MAGRSTSTDSLLAITFPDGSELFVADYRVQASCPACAVRGQAFFGFNFDPAGKFTGTGFTGFTPHYAFSRTESEKIMSVKTGSIFTLLLPSNVSTGYSWQLASTSSAVENLGHKHQAAEAVKPGVEGQELWTFRAGKPGEVRSISLTREHGRKTLLPKKCFT